MKEAVTRIINTLPQEDLFNDPRIYIVDIVNVTWVREVDPFIYI